MKEQDQIRAIAELDEPHQKWDHILDPDGKTWVIGFRYPAHRGYIPAKDYLHSYDAIIPVIRKVWEAGGFAPEKFYQAIPNYYPHILTFIQHTTPSQLCEALLKSTGKWRDK